MVCPLDIVIGSCSLKALSVHEDCQGGKWRSSVNFWWVRFGECLAMARKINDCVRMMFSIVHWLQCATCLLADTVCEGRERMTRDGNEFWRSNIQFLSSCLGPKLCWFKWIYSYLALLLFPLQILILIEVCTVVALDIMALHTIKQLQCSVVYIAYLLYALFSSVQLLSCLRLFVTLWTTTWQASLSITNCWSPSKPMSVELVMPSNHLILCRPLLLPSIFSSIRVFSSESALRIRWPKYWNFSFNINEPVLQWTPRTGLL